MLMYQVIPHATLILASMPGVARTGERKQKTKNFKIIIFMNLLWVSLSLLHTLFFLSIHSIPLAPANEGAEGRE